MNQPGSQSAVYAASMPRHVAVIMDGNGRWARHRGLPRGAGHSSGARQVRAIVERCIELGINYLTLFAFSSENWKRPEEEVSGLMSLFMLYLERELRDVKDMGVRLRVIGDTSAFPQRLQHLIEAAHQQTRSNEVITLTIAANYGGRWDMVQAVRRWQGEHPGQSAAELGAADLEPYLSTAGLPDPDLLLRTGGESRISNFLLWQLAYTELYFSPVLWPNFSVAEFDKALFWYAQKDRRFGALSEQVSS